MTALNLVDLAGNASITSERVVKLGNLKVLVQEGSKVNLNILGTFQIEPSDECDFVYEKHEIAKVIYVQ